jgi:hypothetical protein
LTSFNSQLRQRLGASCDPTNTILAIGETATPHRMGAALTYARRYALFTLVGIAGEDDVDAPDLTAPTNQSSGPEKPKATGDGRLNGGQSSPPRQRGDARPARRLLGPEASAQLRDRLLAELSDLGSGDDLAHWAHRCLPEKNRLTATDAERVEEAFQGRLATTALAAGAMDAPQTQETAPRGLQGQKGREPARQNGRSRPKAVDKSLLALPEPRRVRDRDHVRSVAKRPCLICGRQPSDAHHLGRKVSDEFTVPLCRGHHREVHRCGDEAAWWRKAGIDPTGPARALWLETHPLATAQGGLTAAIGTDQSNAKCDRPVSKRSPNYKTKPIIAAGP